MRRSLWWLLLALGCGDERLVSVGNIDEFNVGEPSDPTCASDDPCRSASFDRKAGRCVEHDVADGMPCESSCLSGAVCVRGECVGSAVSCDDGNPCTLDGCSPEQGCMDFGPASACPIPVNPCMASTCDPALGCGQAPAPDGRACVIRGDRAAGTCRNGSCEPTVPPEACSAACWAGCWPGTSTSTLWTYRPVDPDADLQFAAIADEDGNLFWRERSEDRCFFVSVGIDGTERFRIPSPCDGADRMALLRSGVVLILERSRLVAHKTKDGGLAWLFEPQPPAGCDVRTAEVMAASDDTGFVVWIDSCADLDRRWRRHSLSGIDLSSGLSRFEYSAGSFTDNVAPTASVVSDGRGNAFARFADQRYGSVLLSLGARGTLRWQKSDAGLYAWPVAAVSDRAYLYWYSGVGYRGTSVVRGIDGNPLLGLEDAIVGWGIERFPMHIGAGFAIEPTGRVWSTTGSRLTLYDGDGVAWSHDGCSLGICEPSVSVTLTGSGTLLLPGVDTASGDLTIAEVDGGGRVLRTCTLESSTSTEGPFVLHGGTFVAPLVEGGRVTGLAAWWLPGMSEADVGWTSPGGGPARGGAPH